MKYADIRSAGQLHLQMLIHKCIYFHLLKYKNKTHHYGCNDV